MAAKSLLPGFGGVYTSESFTGTAVGADTIDASRCAQIIIQTSSAAATGAVDLQQSFASGKWANLSTALSLTDAAITPLSIIQGPFGLLRFNAAVTGGTVSFTLVGYEAQGVN
jgi:hypothetical protein